MPNRLSNELLDVQDKVYTEIFLEAMNESSSHRCGWIHRLLVLQKTAGTGGDDGGGFDNFNDYYPSLKEARAQQLQLLAENATVQVFYL